MSSTARPPLDQGVARAFDELDDIVVSIPADDVPRLRRNAAPATEADSATARK